MGEVYSASDIRSALRTFQEYMRDLSEAKFDQFQTKLRLFINYCEKDDHVRVLAQQLHARAGDAREWFTTSQSGGGVRAIPVEMTARMAHQYKVLMELKQQRIDIRNFLSTLFTSNSMPEMHMRFRREWLEPLQASFTRLFQVVEEELGAKERTDLVALMDGALERARTGAKAAAPAAAKAAPAAAPAPVAPAPAAAAAPEAPAAKGKKGKAASSAAAAAKAAAAISGLDLDGLVKLLEKSVKGARDLAAKVKSDVEVDVKILKLALTKSVPDMGVVGRVAEPLQRTGGKIAEIAAALAERARAGSAK